MLCEKTPERWIFAKLFISRFLNSVYVSTAYNCLLFVNPSTYLKLYYNLNKTREIFFFLIIIEFMRL
jgi:hypothetical protein